MKHEGVVTTHSSAVRRRARPPVRNPESVRRALLLLLLAVSACGRSEPIPPVRSLDSTKTTEDGGVYCRSACPGLPPGLKTPLINVQGGAILHWPACEGCLRLTVDRRLTNFSSVKFEGNAWDVTLAGGLCLEEAVFDDDLPENARQRIHLRIDTRGNSVTHRFEVDTGIIRNAEITVSGSISAKEMSFLIGRALGLDKSEDQLNSIMSFPNSQRTSPGEHDQTSLRALYGPPSLWCTN